MIALNLSKLRRGKVACSTQLEPNNDDGCTLPVTQWLVGRPLPVTHSLIGQLLPVTQLLIGQLLPVTQSLIGKLPPARAMGAFPDRCRQHGAQLQSGQSAGFLHGCGHGRLQSH